VGPERWGGGVEKEWGEKEGGVLQHHIGEKKILVWYGPLHTGSSLDKTAGGDLPIFRMSKGECRNNERVTKKRTKVKS